jgi:hypothetical protein
MMEFKILNLTEHNIYNHKQSLFLKNLVFPDSAVPIKQDVGIKSDILSTASLFIRDRILWAKIHDFQPFEDLVKANVRFWFVPKGVITDSHKETRNQEEWQIITGANIDSLILFFWSSEFVDHGVLSVVEQLAEHVEETLLNEVHPHI